MDIEGEEDPRDTGTGDEGATDTGTTDTGADAGKDAGAEAGKAATAADAGKDAGKDTGKPQDPKGSWYPDDWRDQLTSTMPEEQRGKAKEYLKNRSPADLLRSGLSADSKISELTRDRVKIPSGKNDDPKDVAAYRKARGVPEKAENYDIRLPEDFGDMDALDTDLSDEFKKRAHNLNWGQKDFDLAIETVVARDKAKAAETANRILRAREAAQDELRIEFGKEYRGKVELINRFVGEEMKRIGIEDANLRREVLSERFADGMALGEKPWFVKMMANLASKYADDGILESGETEEAGDVDARIEKIMGKMHSEPAEYERMQPELKRLIATQNRRNSRRGAQA